MTPEEQKRHKYIGDGVYVENTPEGLVLRTGSHRDYEADNKIFLEPEVLDNLLTFIEYLKTSDTEIEL